MSKKTNVYLIVYSHGYSKIDKKRFLHALTDFQLLGVDYCVKIEITENIQFNKLIVL